MNKCNARVSHAYALKRIYYFVDYQLFERTKNLKLLSKFRANSIPMVHKHAKFIHNEKFRKLRGKLEFRKGRKQENPDATKKKY